MTQDSVNSVYAPSPANSINSLDECYFYHTMDIPGYGTVKGEWDLRAGVRDYLGGENVNFKGKRVLEMGAASGFLTFTMEKLGADVVGYDLSPDFDWDIVPYAGLNTQELMNNRRGHLSKINNGFWLNHKANNSRAKLVFGTVYDVPEAIGKVDIATFGSILLHLRDPFLALQSALRLTRETAIVTDLPLTEVKGRSIFSKRVNVTGAKMDFLPDYTREQPIDAWWRFTPGMIQRYLGVLGFEKTEVTFHTQLYQEKPHELYTVVGHRTRPLP